MTGRPEQDLSSRRGGAPWMQIAWLNQWEDKESRTENPRRTGQENNGQFLRSRFLPAGPTGLFPNLHGFWI